LTANLLKTKEKKLNSTNEQICFFQSDAEEAKSQEITKLKVAYQKMERQVKETTELLAKEKVAVKIASEKEALVKEVPVVDTALVDKLTAENENLKVHISLHPLPQI
jgi:myosin V